MAQADDDDRALARFVEQLLIRFRPGTAWKVTRAGQADRSAAGRPSRLGYQAFLNTERRVVHLAHEWPDHDSEAYPERASLCGKLVSDNSLLEPDEEAAAARRASLGQALLAAGLGEALHDIYPERSLRDIAVAVERIEVIADVDLARAERRSWTMLDLGVVGRGTVPKTPGAKLCGTCKKIAIQGNAMIYE